MHKRSSDVWNNLSLKEKLRIHYDSREEYTQFKHEWVDHTSVAYFWYLAVSSIVLCHYILIPGIYREDPSSAFWLTCVAWFIAVEMCVNWALTNITRPTLGVRSDGSAPLPGWHYCAACQVNAPPRSHHCKVCKICILKRDHHCFFVANCVGFQNQRRFIVTTTYMAAACAFMATMLVLYLNESIPSFLTYIPPVFVYNWWYGEVSLASILLLVQMYLILVSLPVAAFYSMFETTMAFRGQTGYEAFKFIHRFRGDIRSNLQSVFGYYWLIHFLVPLPLPIHGDGTNWPENGGKDLSQKTN